MTEERKHACRRAGELLVEMEKRREIAKVGNDILPRNIAMRPFIIVCALVVGTVCAGQAPPKKSAPKKPAEKPTFVCPDAEAQEACKSYQELVKAKDKTLPDDAYICFRKKEDEFFALTFSRNSFGKRWDEENL
jgi:hypothetical protein